MGYTDFEFEDVETGATYVKYSNKGQTEFFYEKGDVITTGKYIGFYVDETYGGKKHKFDTGDGVTVLPGTKVLNDQLECVEEGEVLQVVYGGHGDKKIKGNYPHFFKLRRAKGAAKSAPDDDDTPF